MIRERLLVYLAGVWVRLLVYLAGVWERLLVYLAGELDGREENQRPFGERLTLGQEEAEEEKSMASKFELSEA